MSPACSDAGLNQQWLQDPDFRSPDIRPGSQWPGNEIAGGTEIAVKLRAGRKPGGWRLGTLSAENGGGRSQSTAYFPIHVQVTDFAGAGPSSKGDISNLRGLDFCSS